MKKTNDDKINSPSHYAQANIMLEPIDALRTGPFDICCALKYLIRAGHKDDEKQDLKKAEKCLLFANYSYEYIDSDVYNNWYENFKMLLFRFKALKLYRPPKTYRDFFEEIYRLVCRKLEIIEKNGVSDKKE